MDGPSPSAVLLAALAGMMTWLVAALATESLLYGIFGAVGVAFAVLSVRNQLQAGAFHHDKDAALTLLVATIPKLKVGIPIDAAFASAAAQRSSPVAERIGRHCSQVMLGQDVDTIHYRGERADVASMIIAMIRAARVNGGDSASAFASLAQMLETDQKLRGKQQIASLHVGAQANALTAIALIILIFALIGSSESQTFLRETLDGRRMLTFSFTMVLWGYIAINALTTRISDA